MPRPRRLILAVVGAAALLVTGTASASAAPPAHQPATPPLLRPAAAGQGPGAAPVGGVVPGRTGAAARAGAGPAIDRFRAARRDLARRDGRTAGADAAPADQLHTWWGVFPPSASGVQVTHSVFTSPAAGGGDFVYAPTMKPPNGSCIEIVTADSSSGPELWAWDWCNGVTVGKAVSIDAGFESTYTTTVNGLPEYSLDEVQTDVGANTWTAYLYNFSTGAWDTFYTSSGADQSGLNFGWDMFEVYTSVNPATGNGYFCSDTAGKQFDSSGIQLYLNGGWVAADGNNAPLSGPVPAGSSFDCPSLSFSLVSADNHWHVSTRGPRRRAVIDRRAPPAPVPRAGLSQLAGRSPGR